MEQNNDYTQLTPKIKFRSSIAESTLNTEMSCAENVALI